MKTLLDEKLRTLADEEYKAFNQKIIPTDYPVLGVRKPAMDKLAKEIAAHPAAAAWLDDAEFNTYEHVLLYGLVLARMRNMPIEDIFRRLDLLILRFDNWAHVDTVVSSFKSFTRHRDEVLAHFMPLKTDAGEFTKRTFVVLLMDFFMDDDHIDATLAHMVEVQQGQYYVDMALAWALSVGLVKYYDKTLPLLIDRRFGRWVHNKAIQKARESYRVYPETKAFLNTLKV